MSTDVALPQLIKMAVLKLARCDDIERRENIIAAGNSGPGKSRIALGLGLAACQKGLAVGFITAAAMVRSLIEARDERRPFRCQCQLTGYKLLIIDELGYVPLSPTGADCYSRCSPGDTTRLDRIMHHVLFLEMNRGSCRLADTKRRSRKSKPPPQSTPKTKPDKQEAPRYRGASCLSSIMYFYSGQLSEICSGVDKKINGRDAHRLARFMNYPPVGKRNVIFARKPQPSGPPSGLSAQ